MKDTPEAVETKYRELIMKKSGSERLKIGCDLFTAAKRLALVGLLEESSEFVQERLFERFYGRDFSPDQRIRIQARIRRASM